jgi:hypothetical protein
LAGITGALQVAAVLAKPLPAFKKGTQFAPEGMALVAEEGPELRESKGQFYLYQKPTVADLERGDKIYTAAQTTAMLANNVLRQEEMHRIAQKQLYYNEAALGLKKPIIINNSISEKAIARGVSEGLKGMVVEQTFVDERGFRRRIKTQNSEIEYQKNRYKLG